MTDAATEPTTPPLFQSERQHEIATATLQAGRVEVSELALRYNVTTETIRRDLEVLEQRGDLVRIHGGAVRPSQTTRCSPA